MVNRLVLASLLLLLLALTCKYSLADELQRAYGKAGYPQTVRYIEESMLTLTNN